MTYNVHQHWDPLKVCAVGKSYPPEFYNFITNTRVRNVMERIAAETEEDYQKLIKLLESFGVEVLRPEIQESHNYLLPGDSRYVQPPMSPRDYTAMIGDVFYHNCNFIRSNDFKSTLDKIALTNKVMHHNDTNLNSAMITRCGKDLYFGTEDYSDDIIKTQQHYQTQFPDYRCHVVNTGGHSDATFCPVKPGLIISLHDIPSYTESFPDWEVVYLPGQSWTAVQPFLDLKAKNDGKWWVPGEELNDEFTEFVESWLSHWVGYVEETVFDVNMLVIDEKNVVCNNYNQQVFDAFDRHGITPHIVNFRHRYFWDGGLHCITSDLHREGVQKDYFPERGLT
jgi:N-dimethylarginine dimethylaminohydrolase